jgi:hypothetical protein
VEMVSKREGATIMFFNLHCKRRPLTDLEILEEIYDRYYSTFAEYSRNEPNRFTKNYVPIDIKALADHFNVDADIIFGRLYYHLEKKYGFRQPDGSKVEFFSRQIDQRSVQFPLLAAVIAGMREERNKYLWATWVAAASLIISLCSLVVSLIT